VTLNGELRRTSAASHIHSAGLECYYTYVPVRVIYSHSACFPLYTSCDVLGGMNE
jgi:hypothetical protein